MAKAVGLDVGSRTVKLVELDGSPKKFKITKYISREIPGEGGAAEGEIVAETVAEVLREAKASKDNLSTAMDSKSIVIREITVPFLQEDQIRRVLKFEAENHLHNYAIEDVIVDYIKVGESGDQSKLLIFAAPKDRIRERLFAFQANGVEPMHVDLDLTALYNAALATGALSENPNAVILDIGATTTNILFVKDGTLKSCRSLRTGSESITRVLSQDLAVDTDSARDIAEQGDASGREDDLLSPIEIEDDATPETEKSASELETSIAVQRQDDFLGRIFRETTRSIAAHAMGGDWSAIFLTGGASMAPGVKQRLEERFEKPVLRLDFLGDRDHSVGTSDHDSVNAGLGVALGCALKQLDYEDGINVEFRKDDLRYTRKFDLIKVALASTVSLIFILLFLTWLNYQNTLKTRSRELREVVSFMDKKWIAGTKHNYSEVLGDTAKRLPADTTDIFKKLPVWQSQIRTMKRHITSEMGFDVQDIPPIRSALTVWNDLSEKYNAVREELGYLFIDHVKITQKSITFDGLIGNRGNVDALVVELRKLDYVGKVNRRPVTADKKTGKFSFGLTAELTPTKAVARKKR